MKDLRKDVNYNLSNCSDEQLSNICDWLVKNNKDWVNGPFDNIKRREETIISFDNNPYWYSHDLIFRPELSTICATSLFTIDKHKQNKDLLSMARSRNAYKQMYNNVKNQLQEKDYFIEEFRIEIKDLEKDISFYKASLESKDVQIKKMKKYINELEVDKENSRVSSLEYINSGVECYNSKKELEEELQQANKYKTYLHTCLVVLGMALILIGILLSNG